MARVATKCIYLGFVCLLVCQHRAHAALNATLCWGEGNDGELGNGLSSDSSFPVLVAGGHYFASVCTGYDHTCALEPSGKAFCWGGNYKYQRGSSVSYSASRPTEVAGSHTFHSISCGWDHTCALDDEGKAWCWGSNDGAQLGNANNTNSYLPVAAAPGYTFTSMCGGRAHTCGLQAGGNALCWGINYQGQLGANLSADYSYTPVEVAGNHTFQSISCGMDHTCALEVPPTSQAWCWGYGEYGLLGNGELYGNEREPVPVPVAGGRAFGDLALGSYHTCALALDGSAWCWGTEVKNGRTFKTNSPEKVDGGHTFVALSGGSYHTCALDDAAQMWCWGINHHGQLGNNKHSSSETPVRVVGGDTFLALGTGITSSGWHSCAIAVKRAGQGQAPASSVPIGAIVGGVVGAIVVLAVLAFFALRPGKGWLRRKHLPATLEEGTGKEPKADGCAEQTNVTGPSVPATSADDSPPGTMEGAAASTPLATAPAVGGSHVLEAALTSHESSTEGLDTLVPYTSGQAAPTAPETPPFTSLSAARPPGSTDQAEPMLLPPSFISSAGLGTSGQTASRSSGSYNPASDIVLSFVTSYLGSRPYTSTQHQHHAHSAGPGRALEGRASMGSGGGSGPLELRTDARAWEVQWEELTILRRIGRGSYGSVYLAEWHQTRVAVKVLVSQDDVERGQLELPDRVVRDLQAEAAVMCRMRHPNVVQFMGLVAMPPALITEYCGGGSLYDCLSAAREQPAAAAQLTWHRRLAMAIDAATGLLYLHHRGIIHRDVKSPNLLVDEVRVKVADFNLSKILEGARPESSLTSAGAGVTNPIWLAPEVIDGEKPTAAGDVYSFGMVLYELLTWHLPWNFAETPPFKVIATIRQGGRPEVPPREALPGPDTDTWVGLDAYVQLMRECWAQRQSDRPSFDEVVARLRRLLDAS